MRSLLGGRVGVSQKVTNRDGGEGGGSAYLVSQKWPQVLPVTFGGEGGVSPKVTNSDGGEGGVRPIK